jgi:hypothetical protein
VGPAPRITRRESEFSAPTRSRRSAGTRRALWAATTSTRNGVYEKTVDRNSSRIHGYGRPAYGSAAVPGAAAAVTKSAVAGTGVKPITKVRWIEQQEEALSALGYKSPLDVDNEWGPKTLVG